MTFEEATRAAAMVAEAATNRIMRKYRNGFITDEDDLTPYLAGALDEAFAGTIGGLEWNSSILRHRRGEAAEEAEYGADLLIHVSMNTPSQRYSKGILIQAKRVDRDQLLTPKALTNLHGQCKKMLAVTAAAFVFNYARGEMRCGPASRLAGSERRDLHAVCGWTSYRFFLELFRCPIGDPKIHSGKVRDLSVPIALTIEATGELTEETTVRLPRGF